MHWPQVPAVVKTVSTTPAISSTTAPATSQKNQFATAVDYEIQIRLSLPSFFTAPPKRSVNQANQRLYHHTDSPDSIVCL